MSSKSSASTEEADLRSIAKLLNQSRSAADSKVQHLLLVVTGDGHVRIQGTDNFIQLTETFTTATDQLLSRKSQFYLSISFDA